MTKDNRFCVIMCGGIGSRFWPESRTQLPKQFIDFLGTGKSLLQLTVERIEGLVPQDNIIIFTNKNYASIVKEQLPQLKEEQILLEPSRRDTAAGNTWAAHHIYAINPHAKIMVAPSDQLFLDHEAFKENVTKAFEFIEEHDDVLLTFGIKPTRPETAYGYVQVDKEINADFSTVKTFTEKPPMDLAELFVKSGEFYWNSGTFFWDVNAFLSELHNCAPKIAAYFDAANDVYGTDAEYEAVEKIYPSCTSISIDYAVLEKTPNVRVQRVDMNWTDLGTWESLYSVSPKNADGNVTQNSKTLLINSHNNMISISKDKLLVASGLNDYIVVDTPDALLIVPRSEQQKVRTYVNEVKTNFGDKYL